jgi:hypothetical protein
VTRGFVSLTSSVISCSGAIDPTYVPINFHTWRIYSSYPCSTNYSSSSPTPRFDFSSSSDRPLKSPENLYSSPSSFYLSLILSINFLSLSVNPIIFFLSSIFGAFWNIYSDLKVTVDLAASDVIIIFFWAYSLYSEDGISAMVAMVWVWDFLEVAYESSRRDFMSLSSTCVFDLYFVLIASLTLSKSSPSPPPSSSTLLSSNNIRS